ncbi:hypothetical protein C1645_793942, partial [Glomus cerebriforme]
MDSVYTFDTQNNIWNNPKVAGISPTGKVSMTPIIDYNGLIYLFGGYSPELNIYTNEMFVLDTINLSWKNVSSINAPSPRNEYGAVFLPNKNIIYIGGYNKDVGAFTLNEIYLYDTINNTWITKTTYGSIPSARYSISSILGLDGQRIIIYGGLEQNGQFINPENSVYVLNINNFNWYIPKVSGVMPSTRAFHKSVLIGNYMVMTFGLGYNSDILLLDISNNDEYIWTTSFEPSVSEQSDSNPSPSIIISICISTVFVWFIPVSIFLFLKKRRAKREGINNAATFFVDNDESVPQDVIPNSLQYSAIREEVRQNNLRQSSQYNNDQVNNFNVDNNI